MQKENENPKNGVREKVDLAESPEGVSLLEDVTTDSTSCEHSRKEEEELLELIATIIVNHTLREFYEKRNPLSKI